MASERRVVGRERFWREVLDHFSASGLSIRAFCRREGLAESAFYAWRRELRLRDDKSGMGGTIPTRGQEVTIGTPAAFVPAVIAATSLPSASSACDEATFAAPSIALEIIGGCVLRFHGATAAAQLAELVCHLQARGER